MKFSHRTKKGNMTVWFVALLASATLGWMYYDTEILSVIPFLGVHSARAAETPTGWKLFTSPKLGISIDYPSDYALAYSVETQLTSRRSASGVRFTVPKAYTDGTTLVAYDSGVSVEQIPDSISCEGSAFVDKAVSSGTMSERGINYSVAKSVGSAVGNVYEETVYALSDTKPCTAIRYSIHAKKPNVGESAAGYDKKELLKQFDRIRSSIILHN